VAHFRIFGSLVHYHVTKDARKKLEPTTKLDIFVGYTDTPHNYRAYLPSHRMKVVIRDVNFNEEKAMRCSLERELQLHADVEILAPKKEPQDDVEQPHVEEQRVEAPTHAETSKDGRKHTKESDRLNHGAKEIVGTTTSQHRKRRP